MSNYVKVFIITVVLTVLIGLPQACNEVEATDEDCESVESLGQAVIDRQLGWLDILVCPDKEEK